MRYDAGVPQRHRRISKCLLLGLLAVTVVARGQGGAPLLTDDPGTPGPRHWEINLAFTLDERAGARTVEAPLLDANYGIGERLQLKFEIPWILRDGGGGVSGGGVSGIGNALFGVKWRFCDEGDRGVAIGVYPQVEVETSARSARLGLVEAGTGFLLPLLFQKDLGPVSANLEGGYAFRGGGKGRWIWGLAVGHDFGDFEAVTEFFGSADPRLSRAGWTWNAGMRWRATRSFVLLLSAGTGLSGEAGEPRPRALAYVGGQFLFQPTYGP